MLKWLLKKIYNENPFIDKCKFKLVNGFWFAYYEMSDTLYTEEMVDPINKKMLTSLNKRADREASFAETVKLVLRDRKKLFKGDI